MSQDIQMGRPSFETYKIRNLWHAFYELHN